MKTYYALLGSLLGFAGILYLCTLGGSGVVTYKNLGITGTHQQDAHVWAMRRASPELASAIRKNTEANLICESQEYHALSTVWKRDGGVSLEGALDALKDPYITWQAEKQWWWWARTVSPQEPSTSQRVQFTIDRKTILMVYHRKDEWSTWAAPLGAKYDCLSHLDNIVSRL